MSWGRAIRKIADSERALVVDINDYVFGEMIGKGGYGEVHKATNKFSGEEFAVKQLYEEKLRGEKLRRFVNEITTMTNVDNMFLVELCGFTDNPPYYVITKLAENSSLEKYLYKGKGPLTGSQLTCIALGVAYGMVYLHSLNVIHRDLKAANVLLDEGFIPKICDFGIARYEDDDDSMTHKIGTPSSMAPEMMTGSRYDWRVDVYSMGILLYEMSEGKRAFRGFKLKDIFNYVVNFNSRPKFSEKTPPELVSLIQLCWDADPEKRPSFEYIFSQFASGKVSFPGTQRTHVVQFLRMIEKDESMRDSSKNMKMRKLSEVSQWINADENSNSDDEDGKGISSNVIKIISNPNNPKFKKTIRKYSKTVDITEFNEFFSPLYTLLYSKIEPVVIMKAAIEMMDRDTSFIYLFMYIGFFEMLPLRNKKEIDASCDCLSFLFTERSCDITPNQFPLINALLEKRTKRILILYSFYVRSFSLISNPYPIIDNLLNHSKLIIKKKAGYLLMSIIFYMLTSFPDFVENRNSVVIDIIQKCFKSSHEKTVVTTYDAVSHIIHYRIIPEKLVRPTTKLILKHLNNAQIWSSVISFLLRVKNVEINEEMLKILLIRSHQSPRPWILMINIAEQPKGARFLFEHDEWIQEVLRHSEDVARIFLILFGMKEFHSRIFEMPNFHTLISGLLDSDNPKMFGVAARIIRHSPHSQLLLTFLTKYGIAKEFISVAKRFIKQEKDSSISASKVKKNLLLMFDTLSRIGYMNDYLALIDLLVDMLDEPSIAQDAITVIVSLSNYTPIALALKERKIDKYFTKLSHVQSFEFSANLLLKNLMKV